MNPLVPIALFGWLPAVLWLFKTLPVRRAVVVAFIVAWLFLPVVHDPVLGIRLNKMRATCYGILFAVLVFDRDRFQQIRWSWRDLPMAGWCVCPFFSSLTNGLGLYDGFSQSLDQTIIWGLPYAIGRAYLGNYEGLKEVSIGIVLGGLAYVPFCMIEMRVSPQCHTWVYGYFQHSFAQSIRGSGYRPVVFMEHGLAVGAWMASAALIATWLWRTKSVAAFSIGKYRLRAAHAAGLLAVITVLCKSSGALALGIVGTAILHLTVWARTRLIVLLLIVVPFGYVAGRVTGTWSGMEFADFVGTNFDKERSASFTFRLENENLLIGRALESPIFGWGGWSRARVFDQDGKDLTVTDGMWIIALGDRGFVGLAFWASCFILPALGVLFRYSPAELRDPLVAPCAAAAINLILVVIDGLANDMKNPVFLLLAGGIAGVLTENPPRKKQPTTQARGKVDAPRAVPRAVIRYMSPRTKA